MHIVKAVLVNCLISLKEIYFWRRESFITNALHRKYCTLNLSVIISSHLKIMVLFLGILLESAKKDRWPIFHVYESVQF